VACSGTVEATSACSNVEQAGASSGDFVPCAADMIAALDALAPLSQSALKGNKQSRLDGEAALRQLMPMVSEAGGERLLERSKDRDMSDLRAEIHNAVARYRHFYALSVPPDYHPIAARARQQAQWELDRAARHHESARNLYRQIHGR
jgi:hypothetical protein